MERDTSSFMPEIEALVSGKAHQIELLLPKNRIGIIAFDQRNTILTVINRKQSESVPKSSLRIHVTNPLNNCQKKIIKEALEIANFQANPLSFHSEK